MSIEAPAFVLTPHPFPESIQEIHSPEPPVYGMESIQYDEDGIATHLSVEVAGRALSLPRLDVPPQNPIDTIFYLNISKENDPELFDAAADWFASRLLSNNVRVLITPPSHKSYECISEAIRRANMHTIEPIQLVSLVGGKTDESLVDAVPTSVQSYTPITTPDGKKLGIRWDDAVFLSRLTEEERAGLWIADDVLSTGATLTAIKNLVHKVAGESVDPRVMVIAVEAPINDTFPPRLAKDVVAAMVIGEIPGGLPKKEQAEA